MYEYRGLQDIYFVMLYVAAACFALVACIYLLLRRGNAFTDEVRSSRKLRRWTAAFMAAIAASHVWWYVLGIYWLADDRVVRNITAILLDHITLVPLMMGVLLAMLQDRRRPLWPWLVAHVPVVGAAVVGIDQRSTFYGEEMAHLYQLVVVVVFVVYYVNAQLQYGRWLLDNYADLERKEVWQSMLFALALFIVFELYSSNAGELQREYLSQLITIAVIGFLLWRVETLQELEEK
jgi:hypothetical protein